MSREAQHGRLNCMIVAAMPLIILAMIFVVIWFMRPVTEKYFVSDVNARKELVKELEQKLSQMRSQSIDNDPDRFYPHDRYAIVLAIESYYLDKSEQPRSVARLIESGHLDSSSLINSFYALHGSETEWRLEARPGSNAIFTIAIGN